MTENRDNLREHAPHPRKVAVVGAGMVGSTFAYALLLGGLVGEIVLIDIDHKRAEGQAMDLQHAVPLSNPARIWAGDYPEFSKTSSRVSRSTTPLASCSSPPIRWTC